LEITNEKTIKIGSLGRKTFAKGLYAYIGSAKGPGGVKARLCRHLKGKGKTHWHIDYLRKHAIPVAYSYSCKQTEYETVKKCGEKLEPVIEGFGASDDPKNKSHLFKCPENLLKCIEIINKCVGNA